jgi:hypothetical protein
MPIKVKIYSLAISNISHQQPTIVSIVDYLNNKNIYIRKIAKKIIKKYPQNAEVIKDIFMTKGFSDILKIYNITKNISGFVISMDLVI